MEYLPEGSIRDLVRKKGPFREETARLLSAQVALAIQHVHEKGYLHRDISSSNVLIDSKGNAKLIDFGLSQIGTEAWCRCGSLAYMAPEVIRQEVYGTSADWWSFGIVVFVMLVGKTPLAIYAAEKGVDLHLARRDIRYRRVGAHLKTCEMVAVLTDDIVLESQPPCLFLWSPGYDASVNDPVTRRVIFLGRMGSSKAKAETILFGVYRNGAVWRRLRSEQKTIA
ncbi:hypothetical protein HPB47_012509 [Ixodes persulcatus]|uniref:Uncharacterized protein n=1 Tax=Ixodes persulcatus TaxID=34615 RepID=A0AC60NTF9_IXOPE|nr:hypothetical protein HPB47_012509 [Ixodes persulcatus]